MRLCTIFYIIYTFNNENKSFINVEYTAYYILYYIRRYELESNEHEEYIILYSFFFCQIYFTFYLIFFFFRGRKNLLRWHLHLLLILHHCAPFDFPLFDSFSCKSLNSFFFASSRSLHSNSSNYLFLYFLFERREKCFYKKFIFSTFIYWNRQQIATNSSYMARLFNTKILITDFSL